MALIKCSECGKEISDKASQCIHCGNPIIKEFKEEKIICSNCGKELEKDNKFCQYCGSPIDKPDNNLIKCEVCGKNISINAKTCPNCGNPNFKKKVANMQKKKWEELTQADKQKIVAYRKEKKQWWSYNNRALSMFLLIMWTLFTWIFIFTIIPIGILSIILIVIFVPQNIKKLKIEEKQWYENNIDELYENEIIK